MPVMKKRRRQHRARSAFGQRVVEMFELAGAARRDDRYANRRADRARKFQIVTVARAITVHAGQQNLTRAEKFTLTSPLDGIKPGVAPPSVCEHLPARVWFTSVSSACVDCQNNALASKCFRSLANQLRSTDRSRVHRNFVRACAQDRANVFDRAEAATDRERD